LGGALYALAGEVFRPPPNPIKINKNYSSQLKVKKEACIMVCIV